MGSIREVRSDAMRSGEFTYLAASVESSLYRNGKVFMHRDGDGNDSHWEGAEPVKRRMPVGDARNLTGRQRPALDANGFELVEEATAPLDFDFLDDDRIVRDYYPHCAEIVREACGARTVAAFDHNIRSASGNRSQRRVAGGQRVQPPIYMVHGDYTLTSGPRRLRDLAQPPTGNDTYRRLLPQGASLLSEAAVADALGEGRFALVNVWRNIAREPVATHPLALCDAASVHPDDLVVFEVHYRDRVGENYLAKHSDNHRWCFYPAMTGDEALLIKQWDSAGGMARSQGARADSESPDAPCTFSFHTAFEDPMTQPDAPDRWSIEVRCVALYE